MILSGVMRRAGAMGLIMRLTGTMRPTGVMGPTKQAFVNALKTSSGPSIMTDARQTATTQLLHIIALASTGATAILASTGTIKLSNARSGAPAFLIQQERIMVQPLSVGALTGMNGILKPQDVGSCAKKVI